MSVKIRLTKTGKRNQIQYRIVAQDTHTKRDGKFLEILGIFNPFASEKKLLLNEKAYDDWIKKGAKPTVSLSYLMKNGKLPKKAKKVKEEAKPQEQKPQEIKTETQEGKPEVNQVVAKTETPEENKTSEEVKQPESQKRESPETTQSDNKKDQPKKPDTQEPKVDSTEQKAEESN